MFKPTNATQTKTPLHHWRKDFSSPASMHHAHVLQTCLFTSGSVCAQCVATFCVFFGGFQKQTPTLAFLHGQRDGVCVCICVCVSTLCPTWTKANRFFRVCVPVLSWNQVFSLTPPSMKDGRISQEQVGYGDGNIATALPHFCALSDYTEATGGPDLKVAADCLWMWHSRPESRAADQPSFHIIRISPHVEQRDAKDDGW